MVAADFLFYSEKIFCFVGLFDAHRVENCSIPNSVVLQQMYNIAVTIEALNAIEYLPGLSIGTYVIKFLKVIYLKFLTSL